MAQTHRDVVQRAAFRVGLKRAGQDLGGDIYAELLAAFEDLLLELNEDQPLDFDPTDASGVPDERMGALVAYFMYQPVFDQFDLRRGPEAREVLARVARKRFFAQVVGDSDYIESECHNY